MTDAQAQVGNEVIDKLQAAATEQGISDLPVPYHHEGEDGSVYIDYHAKEKRIGINIELDPNESGWHILSKSGLMEWGYMKDFDALKLLRLWANVPESA